MGGIKSDPELASAITAIGVHYPRERRRARLILANHTFDKVADVVVENGRFQYTFEPGSLYSLTTTTGQGRHIAEIPPPAAFPFPYSDDFEKTNLSRSPKFLADQDGAFEVETCEGLNGKCMVQHIELKPIPWMPLPNPFTLMGDSTWRDYSINVDVHLPKYGAATVIGRIDSANVFQGPSALNPAGYVLTLNSDGNWQIASTAFKKTDKVLASGNCGPISGTWRHVHLAFRDSHITAELDQVPLSNVIDTDHAAGQVAVGSTCKVAFDNLSITNQ
jgi:hypothetical protein